MASQLTGFRFSDTAPIEASALRGLYQSVGWTAYLKDETLLPRALKNSLYHKAVWDGEQLIGLVRVVGDGLSIAYVQDLLVHPAYQGRGIGKKLLQDVLSRYADVRQLVLLTDNNPDSRAFYTACGLSEAGSIGTCCFVRFLPA